ncbi:MAG: Rieske 2Fe-2S domain-containing protein [Chloroflexi bacterium]|nr:MAG: Rieske 2Fe-2S domain-containing protein [Chloroflexota bacterium]TME42308.1 MAG: Rieske 2Fe-2S domain-containing protein [Chloroflexota bacterium]
MKKRHSRLHVWPATCTARSEMSSPRNTAGHIWTKNAKWLDGFAKFFEAIVGGFYKIPGTGWIKTLLHGTWPLGHPLHPAITDITIGAYTAAVALDVAVAVTGDLTLTRAADFVLVVAFISSLIAILSGFTDWQHTFGEEKRTGMLHSLIMLSVSVLFLVSIIMRGTAPDARGVAMWLSGIGWAIMLVGAFFGGELPYGYGTEVNRQAWNEHPGKWTKLDVAARGLDDRKPVVGKAKDLAVFVVKLDGAIYAIANKCTHAGGPLNEGKWVGNDRCEIQCPWHGSRFCVKDGGVRAGPATFPEPRFETRVTESGFVEIRAKD